LAAHPTRLWTVARPHRIRNGAVRTTGTREADINGMKVNVEMAVDVSTELEITEAK
jgi:hypothetical protein